MKKQDYVPEATTNMTKILHNAYHDNDDSLFI
jgi:hypothetical protein